MLPVSIYSTESRNTFLKRIWTYLEVGRLLHVIAILSAISSMFFFNLAWDAFLNEKVFGTIFFGYLFLHSLTIPIFSQLDAYSRFQNYKLLKDLMYKYGFQIRFIKTFSYTKCQREAALYAARDFGYKPKILEYFRERGYRWYHVFPDFVWSHPEYLLTKQFWSTTFFVKTYKPRYYYY